MKTFIALSFFGILTYAYAATTGISQCQEVNGMEGFSATNFFTRTWYVTHVQKETSKTVCQTFTASKPTNTTYVVEYTFENDKGVRNNVRCEGERGEYKKITFNCKNGGTTFTAVFVVMDTDYNNYALFYRCVTMASGDKDDNYLVLSRTDGNQQIPTNLTSLTTGLDLKSCEEIKSKVL
uniref:Salivary lipocalin 4 n=1 Tax=Triatoma brasiliensis TaxID=65344 RepID=Q0MTE3_TRIBS|nr:salivary lipocalin 4 [Triatoma brasiliensis]